jgi:hypothetical protein
MQLLITFVMEITIHLQSSGPPTSLPFQSSSSSYSSSLPPTNPLGQQCFHATSPLPPANPPPLAFPLIMATIRAFDTYKNSKA